MDPKAAMASILRGCVECHTRGDLARKLNLGRALRVKLGVDPTSPDLHLGHTVILSRLRAFQDLGHTAVLIIGDFTALVGDPSGRDSTRPALTPEEVLVNARTYQEQAFKILDESRTELRCNSEWLVPFMREGLLGTLVRHTVQQVLSREDFKKRMADNSPLTLLEILYPVFQGYDSVAVKADVELGGNDQLFNLLMGRKMQQDAGQEAQVALTFPLLVGTDGVKKMSKSYGNHVALTDSPREMFGKLMKVSDLMMYSYYELLTGEDLAKVRAKHPMEAKKGLAEQVTARYHGASAAKAERDFFEKTFSKKVLPDNIPTVYFDAADKGCAVSQFLAANEVVPSRKEGQRLIQQGAVKINGKTLKEDVSVEKAFPEGDETAQVGKHKFFKMEKK